MRRTPLSFHQAFASAKFDAEQQIRSRKNVLNPDHPLFVVCGSKSALGLFGERLIAHMYHHTPRISGEHDLIINNVKQEIKTARAHAAWWNQIYLDKDWDEFIGILVEDNRILAYHASKVDIQSWPHLGTNNGNCIQTSENVLDSDPIFTCIFKENY